MSTRWGIDTHTHTHTRLPLALSVCLSVLPCLSFSHFSLSLTLFLFLCLAFLPSFSPTTRIRRQVEELNHTEITQLILQYGNVFIYIYICVCICICLYTWIYRHVYMCNLYFYTLYIFVYIFIPCYCRIILANMCWYIHMYQYIIDGLNHTEIGECMLLQYVHIHIYA